ncbi:MAG: ATP-dependent Clp protease ATP-binding subunit [Planctomycetes bacterium]|nr:ATP-dependent Clp protease ATP-binding subunit [Planctomycetota bacterium]
MFDRFTDRARKVMSIARQEAQRLNSDVIGTEHILLGVLQEGQSIAAKVLQSLGVNFKRIRQEIEKLAQPAATPTITLGQIPLSPRAKRVVELAGEIAQQLGQNAIATEHLLLGVLREGEGIAAQSLMNMDIKLEDIRDKVLEELGVELPQDVDEKIHSKGRVSRTPALDTFGRDLTQLARDNKLDPVVGRREEIQRVIQILSRRTKNNPVLIGEAGVGKTAIVEGLAQQIIKGEIPEVLKDKRIVILDLALMVAGTKYRGQFEERIKAIMNEVKRAKNVILFIDEIHTLVGAGGAEGAIDAANVLKPALSRGEIQCIGATTQDEYRKYIEKDSALERRFQIVLVDEPSDEETYQILLGLRDKYEAHHRIRYSDIALKSCVELSTRYITGRHLPDKAIDVMDEAGAKVRLNSLTPPPDVRQLEEEVKRLEREKDEAISLQEFERAASLRDKAFQLKKKKEQIISEWKEKSKDFDGTVDDEIVHEVVSMMTGIPLTKIEDSEAQRLLKLEDELHKTVVSQDEATKAISKAIRRSRSGLKDPKRPMGVFVFLGPTGVGKTLMSKALAKFMFGTEDALVAIDMSEYMEKHSVSRLIGAPPGYVGYEEGGQLTEKIRRRPYAVVLLDEIEKAHPDIFNMLLQIFEEGRLTDSFGRNVDFRNTIIIMTSNIGAELIKGKTPLGFRKSDDEIDYKDMKERLTKEVERYFRPEFINRIDDIIVFKPLNRKDLRDVVKLELGYLKERLIKKHIHINVNEDAIDYLLEKGYAPEFGARPIRRSIERYLEDPLSDEILKNIQQENLRFNVLVKKEQIVFERIQKEVAEVTK